MPVHDVHLVPDFLRETVGQALQTVDTGKDDGVVQVTRPEGAYLS